MRMAEEFIVSRYLLTFPRQELYRTLLALAQRGALFLFDLGYFKIQALARLALAGAYFLTRLNHQTKLFAPSARGLQHVELTQMLQGVEGNLIERHIFIGAIHYRTVFLSHSEIGV